MIPNLQRYPGPSLAIVFGCALILALSGCTVEGEHVSANRAASSSQPQTTSTSSLRQTDKEGNNLPFRTTFANRWNSNNDGTSYEPCTSISAEDVENFGLDATSVKDAATADFQSARGCSWRFANKPLATLSQYVGDADSLASYKRENAATSNFLADTAINGRTISFDTLGQRECTAIIQSQRALVFTTVILAADPPPVAEICDTASNFTRATINQIPE